MYLFIYYLIFSCLNLLWSCRELFTSMTTRRVAFGWGVHPTIATKYYCKSTLQVPLRFSVQPSP